MNSTLTVVKNRQNLITNLLHVQISLRRKRGLFNIVGSSLKFLFGTLDASDAEKIIEINQNNNLSSERMSIFSNALDTINASFAEQTKFMNGLVNHLNSINIHLANLTDVVRNIVEQERFINALDSHLIFFESLLNKYRDYQNHLIETILYAFEGKLHPLLMSPSNLLSLLLDAQIYLPKDISFPFTLIMDNVNILYSLITPTIFLHDNALYFILHMPLVSSTTYELIRVTSVPAHIKEEMYAFISIDHQFLLMDQLRVFFAQLTSQEIQKCVQHSKGYICKQQVPLLSVKSASVCETELFRGSKVMPETCVTRVILIKSLLLIALGDNRYIFVAPILQNVFINCQNQPNVIKLNSTGIVQFDPCCKIHNDNFVLNTNCVTTAPTTTVLDFVSESINLKEFLTNCTNFNLSVQLKAHNVHIIQKIEMLNNLGKEITQLKQLNDTPFISEYHHVHHYVMLYMTILIIICIVSYRYFNFKKIVSTQNTQEPCQIELSQVEISNNPNYKFHP